MKKKQIIIKVLKSISTIILILVSTLAVLGSFSIKWMFRTWTNLTMDELMYHITSPLDGTNEGMISDYLGQCVAPTILILLFVVFLLLAFRKSKKKYWITIGSVFGISIVILIGYIHYAWSDLNIGDYVNNQGTYSTFVDDNYVDPRDVEIKFPEQKRNLIYIFLESMETTYADEKSGGAFEENIIPELTELAEQNESFLGEADKINGAYAMPGATWTAAAMFAQTAGIPLNTAAGNDMDKQESFYGNTITMGDILEEAGYSQTLMIGSDATFGGRKLYFTEHGNYNIWDYNYAIDESYIPEDYRVFWGFEDDKLFEFAKDELTNLSQSEDPFNITLLTVDTHFEDGYVCEDCEENFENNQYANVMACSSRKVEEFVTWVQQQPFYDNTTIVLVGDHPTMDSDFCDDVSDDYTRKVYVNYINSATDKSVNEDRNYTTFDMFPTTLASLGVSISGESLGLGTNLFAFNQTLTERYGIETEERELSKKSKLINELSKLDSNEEVQVEKGASQSPSAEVFVGEYNFTTGLLPVEVRNISGVENDAESILIGVWTNESQDDLQWIQLGLQEDGNYSGAINIPSFGYTTGQYNIHAYLIDTLGDQYFIGEAVGIVQ